MMILPLHYQILLIKISFSPYPCCLWIRQIRFGIKNKRLYFILLSPFAIFVSELYIYFTAAMDHAEKQMTLDKRYMRMATIWAENSYCQRRQVGALIVKDKMIISDGYNGTPAGFENRCEDETGHTYPYVLHAEANAITKVACSNNSSEGATLYVTSSPCIECAKLIIQSGIKRVVFSEYYRLQDGIELLRKAGISVDYVPVPEK